MTGIAPKNLVRIGSHRAREKLWRLLGGPVQTYFSWRREGIWCHVPPEKRQAALQLTGISAGPNKTDDLCPHWTRESPAQVAHAATEGG